MADVHRRGVQRGSIHAPQVTIDYDRAVEMRRQQSEAFWGSWLGGVAAVLFGLALFALIPSIIGLFSESWVGFWVTVGVEVLAVVVMTLTSTAEPTSSSASAPPPAAEQRAAEFRRVQAAGDLAATQTREALATSELDPATIEQAAQAAGRAASETERQRINDELGR